MQDNNIPSGWKRVRSLSNDPLEEESNSRIPSGWRIVEKFPERKEPEPESRGGYLLRSAARTASRAAETAIGFPKTIMNVAEGAYGLIPESLRGFTKDTSSYGLPGTPFAENLGPKIWEGISNLLPSSQGTREAIGSTAESLGAPKGYLEPETPDQKYYDELVQDFTSFIMPPGGITKAGGVAKGLYTAAKRVIPANLASYATKKITGNETLGNVVKVGTMLLSSIAGIKPVDLEEEGKLAYNAVTKSIKPGDRVPSGDVLKIAEKLEKDFVKLGYEDLPSKKKLGSFIDSLKKKSIKPVKKKPMPPTPEPSRIIQHEPGVFGIPPKIEKPLPIPKEKLPEKSIDLKELWQFKKDTKDIFDILEKDTQASAHVTQLRHELNDILKNKVKNKEFSTLLTEADHIHGTVKEMKKISGFVDKTLGGEGAKYAFARSFLHNPRHAIKNAVLARGIMTGLSKTQEAKLIFDLMGKSPKMKAAYSGVLKSAAKEHGPGLLKQAAKLQDSITTALDKLV